MMEYRILLFVTIILLANPETNIGSSTIDPWYHGIPQKLLFEEWVELEENDYYEVIEAKKSKATQLLEKAAIRELTEKEASEFTGKKIKGKKSKKPFLVRGLYHQKYTGGFYVSILGDLLWITHSSLGSGSASMKRQPLIVLLERLPKEVFITSSMDE